METHTLRNFWQERSGRIMVALLMGAVVAALSFSIYFARAAGEVTNVVLTDTDSSGTGLDGRDFSISWTASSTVPAGFTFTKIFILPSSTALTVATINSACTNKPGNVCEPMGFFNQFSMNQFMVPQFIGTDSNGVPWSASQQYVAWVYVSSTAPFIVSSSPMTPVSDVVADTFPANIEHFGVYAATESAAATLHAFVLDDQTTAAQFANTADGEAELFKVYYATSTALLSASPASANAVSVTSSLFKFTVPSTHVPAAGGKFYYYLRAQDRAGNNRFFCTNPQAATSTQCAASPFEVTTLAAGARTISGTISSGGVALAGATVFAGGFGGAAVTTDGSGNYSLANLPNSNSFDLTAAKGGYCKNIRNEVIGTLDKTGINLSLNPGECVFFSGGGGSGGGGAPTVMFSGPPDGMQGFPPNEKIRIGMSQTLNANTVNDNNAADAGSNVYLTTNGTDRVIGTVTFCETSSAAGCSSLFSQDTNTILFNPTSNLATNTLYTLVITEGVTSQSGQSIQGNRAGGGHKISFSAGGGTFSGAQITSNFGMNGEFMPPYVKSVIPGPGVTVAPNVKIILEFNTAMNSATISTSSITLRDATASSSVSLSSVSLDSNEKRFVTIVPASAMTAGREYEVRVKGAVATVTGLAMRPPTDSTANAFSSFFKVSGSNDATAATVFPRLVSGETGVAVNNVFEYGFNEPLLVSTLNTTNVTMTRGSTAVSVKTEYDPGKNSLYVAPNSVLAPNTVYTVTIAPGVTDLAGNGLATSTFTYTTGAADTAVPVATETRCDDFTCRVFFNEAMNHDTQADSNFTSSTLNHARYTLTQGGADLAVTSSAITYDEVNKSVTISGLTLTKFTAFTMVVSGLTDISGNAVAPTTFNGKAEDSSQTFGSFGDFGMFGPPIAGTSTVGGEFKPMGFGSFTPEQFAFGQAVTAFPFNQTAGQDANVFQVRFTPGVVLQNADQVVLTFPDGTTVANAALDTFSPFVNDFNQQGAGTVTGTAVSASASANTVTITLGVFGTPGANDNYTIDLRKIINPSIPKSFTSGGYTLGVKVLRGGVAQLNKTSMPYFISGGGSNTIVVGIFAGSTTSPNSVAGTAFLHGGGPAGPMDKNVTLTAGVVSAVEGTVTTSVRYASLSDGCYFFGTDPSITLESTDYFGQFSPEPVCVSGGETKTKNIVLTSAAGAGSITTTIKLAGIADFGSVDIDIFAGGPGRFVVKTLTAVAAPNASGYTLKLPANGAWFIGVGPAMPKTAAGGTRPASLPGVPPSPVNMEVTGLGTGSAAVTRSSGSPLPAGVTFNDTTDVITFTFASADKTVTGTVTDGTSVLSNVEVFLHRQGFGASVHGTTNASGTFSLAVSDVGIYEIGAFKDGLPPIMQQIEVKSGGAVYFGGKIVSGSNPLTLKLKKPSFTISGKVLDQNNNAVTYAPVFASNQSTGQFVGGMTSADGSYTLFVEAGAWNVQSMLPPDKSDSCGSFSLSVTITTESKSSQNITPSVSTCYTLSGTVSVGGAVLANVPLFVEEWDATNSRPAPGGIKKPTATDSAGAYSVKVAGSKTYRIGTWHPDYGELSATKAVSTADATQNVTVATTATTTVAFTGGSATMRAFVELKNSSDTNKVIRKEKTGLDTSLAMATESGATYNYFVDVDGVGKFSGTVAAGATATIALGITASDFITVTGTIKNNSGTALPGALVTFTNTSTKVLETALTDSNGQYSISMASGTYNVSAALSGYVPGAVSQIVAFTTNTASYDFGGSSPDQAQLNFASSSIKGVISDANSAPITEGRVWATKSDGVVVSAEISATDGSYTLPVTDGSWTVTAVAPNSVATNKTSAVTVSGSDSTSNNFNLAVSTTSTPTSTSGAVSASTGGSLNDSTASGIKLTAGAGVLETGSGNVTLNLEKTFTAPATEDLQPLANASFQITATGNSTIKDLNGNAEIQLNYTSLIASLPSGLSESDLKLMYYSTESNQYVPVEGGFTVDATNNTITGLVDHFTDFVIAYDPSSVPAAATPAPAGNTGGSGGGGGSPTPATVTATTTVAVSATTTPVVAAPVVATTAVTASTAATTLAPASAEEAAVTMAVAVEVSNPSSAIAVTVLPKPSYQPGATMQFKYQYTNGSATKLVTITRELLNSRGKVVAKSSANTTLKAKAVFKASPKQALGKKLPAGIYTMRIKIIDRKTKKTLDENSFKIEVEKLKRKMFTIGSPDASAGALTFDAAVWAKIVSNKPLPANFKFRYSYLNDTDKKQTVRMVRELVGANGKVAAKSSGRWIMTPGEKDSLTATQAVAANLAVGEYTVRLRAEDWKNKKIVYAENSFTFKVELK